MKSTTPLLEEKEAAYSGTVEVLEVTFRSGADEGYAVMVVEDEGTGEEFTLMGPVSHLRPGDRTEVSGDWEVHTQHGRRLRVVDMRPLDPVDRHGLIAYLSSLRHIGPARAARLVDKYGKGILGEIESDPEGIFSTLSGVNPEQAIEAAESWRASRAIRDLHIQLAPHGLAYLAAAIHRRYGRRAMDIVNEDPYKLTEIRGIGFARADKIALATDMPPESEQRARGAAVFVLEEAEQQGHTNLPVEELVKRTGKLIGSDPDPGVVTTARGLVVDYGYVYREKTLKSEISLANTLRVRAEAPPCIDYDPDPELGSNLTDEQWDAVCAAFESRISVITGGPGVGKTVCTRAIVDAALDADVEIALCAPTGRAARRLEEATDYEAKTIHRMLEWRPGEEPGFNFENPLPVDLVIVDESSMLNLRLMEILIDGLDDSTHIVFVGDADQLPPIGAGKPFEDLIESAVAPIVRLTQIFRQAARSMITTAAHAINNGLAPRLRPTKDQDRDFFFIDRRDATETLDAVVDVVTKRVPGEFECDPIRDVQVLAPLYKGTVGIDSLNERLAEELNPDGALAVKGRFRIGDRLIQTRNSHELGLMNGSIVFLREDDPRNGEILVDTDEGGTLAIPYSEAVDLRLAYAISVHKAQGCEVPVIIALCHRSQGRMLNRPLLYTAITRARDNCVLIGERGILRMAVRRDDGSGRFSGLAERLQS